MFCLIQAEQERLRETLKAQEEAIREAITKEKKDKESSKERFVLHNEQDVTLTGRNTTGLPCSVGHPTVHVPGGRPAGLPAGIVTDDDDRRQPAKFNTGPLGRPVINSLCNSPCSDNADYCSSYSAVCKFKPVTTTGLDTTLWFKKTPLIIRLKSV